MICAFDQISVMKLRMGWAGNVALCKEKRCIQGLGVWATRVKVSTWKA